MESISGCLDQTDDGKCLIDRRVFLSSSPAEVVSDVLLECVASVAVVDILLTASKGNGINLVGHKVEVREGRGNAILSLVVGQVCIVRHGLADLESVLKLNPDFLVGSALATVPFGISVQQTSNEELFRADFFKIFSSARGGIDVAWDIVSRCSAKVCAVSASSGAIVTICGGEVTLDAVVFVVGGRVVNAEAVIAPLTEIQRRNDIVANAVVRDVDDSFALDDVRQ